MKIKYNEKIMYRESSSVKGNVYLKYRDYIEDLLTPTIDSYRKYPYDKLYIKHKLFREIKRYKDKRDTDEFLYITGLTGNGKTSLLKYTFKHYENTYVIDGKTLILPFACDNCISETNELKKRLADLFFGIIRKLCEEYGLKKIGENTEEFRDYIVKRRIQFSGNLRGWREITSEELLDQLYEDNILELALLAFKYTMSQDENPIDNFVFIMDDVESVGVNMEVYPIYLANKVGECLGNRSKKEKQKWCCTVIVACRHFVFRIIETKKKSFFEDDQLLIKADVDRSTMESFSGNDYDIGQCPSLKLIIDKRENTIEEFMSEEEKGDFKEICAVLNSIVSQAGELLLALNVNDYRATFRQLKKVIYNKRWLQRFESLDGAFKIGTAEENFFRNKPNIMRAIAMGENDVYFGDRSVIPNLLQNSREGGDLWKLLVMGLFVNRKGDDWESTIDLELLKGKMKEIFGENESYTKEINNALVFLIENRLLLRGKHEEQHDSVDLRRIDAEKARFVYPSSAVKILWDNLAENSILFELFVDDIWIENPYRTELDHGKKFLQFNLNNFKECVGYLDYLIDIECDIRMFLKNRGNTEAYIEHFGKEPITKQLYKGLWSSYNAYFKNKSSGDESERDWLERQLSIISKRISGIN